MWLDFKNSVIKLVPAVVMLINWSFDQLLLYNLLRDKQSTRPKPRSADFFLKLAVFTAPCVVGVGNRCHQTFYT